MDIKQIQINDISPNDYNPNVAPDAIMAKLRAEFSQKGLCKPIIVRCRDDGYVIVDGEHRWRICRNLGWKTIPCVIWEYDDSEAKIKTLQINYMRGSALPVKLAHLIHDLSKEIKVEELIKMLPYEKGEIADNLELLKLPEGFGKEVELKAQEEEQKLPVVISFVVYKNQEEVIEEAIRIAKQELPDGTKNSKALALERICAYFVANKEDKEKQDAPKDL